MQLILILVGQTYFQNYIAQKVGTIINPPEIDILTGFTKPVFQGFKYVYKWLEYNRLGA